MKKAKIVKFKTKNLGLLEDGLIINIFLIASDYPNALLYYPKDKKGCGCLIFAELNRFEEFYIDSDHVGKNNFINLVEYDINFKKYLDTLNYKDLKNNI